MIVIKNVLVGTDFSPASEAAMMYARTVARTFSSKLHVIHVVDDLTVALAYSDSAGGLSAAEMQREIEQTGREMLEAAVTESDRRELHAVAVVRTSGSPAKEIVSYAQEAAIDIIVVGATGRGVIDRVLMGSVADKVIRRAPCPVLTVRTPEREFIVPDALQVVPREGA